MLHSYPKVWVGKLQVDYFRVPRHLSAISTLRRRVVSINSKPAWYPQLKAQGLLPRQLLPPHATKN